MTSGPSYLKLAHSAFRHCHVRHEARRREMADGSSMRHRCATALLFACLSAFASFAGGARHGPWKELASAADIQLLREEHVEGGEKPAGFPQPGDTAQPRPLIGILSQPRDWEGVPEADGYIGARCRGRSKFAPSVSCVLTGCTRAFATPRFLCCPTREGTQRVSLLLFSKFV